MKKIILGLSMLSIFLTTGLFANSNDELKTGLYSDNVAIANQANKIKKYMNKNDYDSMDISFRFLPNRMDLFYDEKIKIGKYYDKNGISLSEDIDLFSISNGRKLINKTSIKSKVGYNSDFFGTLELRTAFSLSDNIAIFSYGKMASFKTDVSKKNTIEDNEFNNILRVVKEDKRIKDVIVGCGLTFQLDNMFQLENPHNPHKVELKYGEGFNDKVNREIEVSYSIPISNSFTSFEVSYTDTKISGLDDSIKSIEVGLSYKF